MKNEDLSQRSIMFVILILCAFSQIQVGATRQATEVYDNVTKVLFATEEMGTLGSTTPRTGFDSRFFHDWRDDTVAMTPLHLQVRNGTVETGDFAEDLANATKCINCTCLHDADFEEIVTYLFKRFIGPNWGKITSLFCGLVFVVVAVVVLVHKLRKNKCAKCCHMHGHNPGGCVNEGMPCVTTDLSTQSHHGTVTQDYPTKLPLQSSVECPNQLNTVSCNITAGGQEFCSDTNKLLAQPFLQFDNSAAPTVEEPPPLRPFHENAAMEDCPSAATCSRIQRTGHSVQELISAMKVLETCLWELENSTVIVTSELIKKFAQAFGISSNQISTCEGNSKTTVEFFVNVFKCMHNKLGQAFTPDKMVTYFRQNEMILLAEVLEGALEEKGYSVQRV